MKPEANQHSTRQPMQDNLNMLLLAVVADDLAFRPHGLDAMNKGRKVKVQAY